MPAHTETETGGPSPDELSRILADFIKRYDAGELSTTEAREAFFANIGEYRRITGLAKRGKLWPAMRGVIGNLSALPFFLHVFIHGRRDYTKKVRHD